MLIVFNMGEENLWSDWLGALRYLTKSWMNVLDLYCMFNYFELNRGSRILHATYISISRLLLPTKKSFIKYATGIS